MNNFCVTDDEFPIGFMFHLDYEFNWDQDIEFLRIHIILKLFMETQQFIRKIACLFSAIFDFEYWIQYKMLCRHRHLL